MKNKFDKNGKLLKGATIWTRSIKEAGGLDAYNKKVAMDYFESFINSNPDIASGIADGIAKKERNHLKLVK